MDDDEMIVKLLQRLIVKDKIIAELRTEKSDLIKHMGSLHAETKRGLEIMGTMNQRQAG